MIFCLISVIYLFILLFTIAGDRLFAFFLSDLSLFKLSQRLHQLFHCLQLEIDTSGEYYFVKPIAVASTERQRQFMHIAREVLRSVFNILHPHDADAINFCVGNLYQEQSTTDSMNVEDAELLNNVRELYIASADSNVKSMLLLEVCHLPFSIVRGKIGVKKEHGRGLENVEWKWRVVIFDRKPREVLSSTKRLSYWQSDSC